MCYGGFPVAGILGPDGRPLLPSLPTQTGPPAVPVDIGESNVLVVLPKIKPKSSSDYFSGMVRKSQTLEPGKDTDLFDAVRRVNRTR